MFWHGLSVLLSPLYVFVARLTRDDRDRLILVLRQHVLILQRQQAGRRPTLTRTERLALVLACAGMARRRLLDALVIVRPDTLVRYYNERRPHRSLSLRTPAGPRDYPRQGEIARRQVLGGVVNDYYRKAA
jgi:hypothetical protein